jgi:hypothetical protein
MVALTAAAVDGAKLRAVDQELIRVRAVEPGSGNENDRLGRTVLRGRGKGDGLCVDEADLMRSSQGCSASRTKVSQNQLELFKRRAQVFDDPGGDQVGVFKVRRVFQAVVLEP